MTTETMGAQRRMDFWDEPSTRKAEEVVWSWAKEVVERSAGGDGRIAAKDYGGSSGGSAGSRTPINFAYQVVEAVLRKIGGAQTRGFVFHVYNPLRGETVLQKASYASWECNQFDEALRLLSIGDPQRNRLLEQVEKRILRDVARAGGGARC